MTSPLAVLKGHEGAVESAAFTPGGSRIVTASGDKTARLWDVSRAVNPNFDDLAKLACTNYLHSSDKESGVQPSKPTEEELRLVGFENEFDTPPDLCANYP
jgi:WD40 repeat protein